MKAIDIKTNTVHDVVSIDYRENIVVLESKEFGINRKTIDNVRLSLDKDEDMKGKIIVHPEAFWTIPFVGWFMIIYKLFSIKDCVIVSDKIHHQLYMLIAGYSPILLITLLMFLKIK